MEQFIFIPNASQKRRRAFARFGIILANISILGAVASFATALSFIGIIAFYVVMALLLIISFLTLLANPQFMALFGDQSSLNTFMAIATQVAPYVLGATIGCSVFSLVFLSFDKEWKKAKPYKAVSIVTLVAGLLMLGIYLFIKYQFTA